jgi:hypothetical protein
MGLGRRGQAGARRPKNTFKKWGALRSLALRKCGSPIFLAPFRRCQGEARPWAPRRCRAGAGWVDSLGRFGEIGVPAAAGIPSRRPAPMTWAMIFAGIAIFVLFPALSFLITTRLYKR